MKRYYDYEYNRIVGIQEVERQCNWFKENQGYKETFEKFANDNFREIRKLTELDRQHEDFIYGQETAKEDIEKYGLDFALSFIKGSELFILYDLAYEEYVLSQIA